MTTTIQFAFHPDHVFETATDTGLDALNDFVFQYCDDHGIECDGGVFGMLFSGADRTWSMVEAISIIEEGARTYNLR